MKSVDKQNLEPLVTTLSSRTTERRRRKDQFLRITVPKSAVEEYLQEGWEEDRELKVKTRLKKPKSPDENFENRLWCLT